MAATTSFPPLTLAAPEDTMQISSPAQQTYDDDIDLDFGDYDGGVQLQEDEHMLTDGETRPPTATDLSMDDDVQHAEPVIHEEEMHDDTIVPEVEPEQEDEDLIDYGDDEYYDEPQQQQESQIAEAVDVPQVEPEEVVEDVDEEIARVPEEIGTELANAPVVTEPAPEASLDEAVQVHASELHALDQEPAAAEAEDITWAGSDALATWQAEDGGPEPLADQASAQHELQGSVRDAEASQPPLTVNTSLEADAEGPSTPTDTGLHPTTVWYGEHFMPLFKSKRQPDGLLKDDNLASLSLAELMRNCRQRLAQTIGKVPEDQELTLAFDHMGLMLVENSRAAFEHSLNDVLEVYLQLHQNDGTEQVPPLSLTLTCQQFSSQMALLREAAAGGKGMSDFVGPAEEEDEEFDEGNQEDVNEDVEKENQDNEHAEHEQYHEEGTENLTDNAQNEDPEYHSEDASNNYYEHDVAVPEYTEGHEFAESAQQDNQLPPKLPPGHKNEEITAEPTASQLASFQGSREFPAATELSQASESLENPRVMLKPTTAEEDGETHNALSTASSTTVQGDQANDGYGEYDLIDWDDDSDLTLSPSDHATDGHDDYSTFLTDFENEEGKVAPETQGKSVAAEDFDGLDGQRPTGDEEHGVTAEAYTGADPLQAEAYGTEDFADTYFDEHAYGDGGDDEHEHDHERQDEQEHTEEDYQDQADIFDAQQDEHQPGEEDELYPAAHGFPETEDQEHGPEHNPTEDEDAGEHRVPTKEETHQEFDARQDETNDLLDPEDDIGFDDYTTEQHEARKGSHPDIAAAVTSNSPLGKRSFDEAADADEIDFDEPELKKARSG